MKSLPEELRELRSQIATIEKFLGIDNKEAVTTQKHVGRPRKVVVQEAKVGHTRTGYFIHGRVATTDEAYAARTALRELAQTMRMNEIRKRLGMTANHIKGYLEGSGMRLRTANAIMHLHKTEKERTGAPVA